VISENSNSALVVWFCGLPGSGKSTIAGGVYENIVSGKTQNSKIALVEMDAIRRLIFPIPTYSDQERDAAYRSLVLIGKFVSSTGVTVLLDGTGHKKVWRDFARQLCPKFVEVYVRCPIEVCLQRETSRSQDEHGTRQKLYRDALLRLKTGVKIEGLGKVPGVDEPFEESPSPEIVIDSSSEKPESLVNGAIEALSKFDPKLFYIESQN
jgi:adenylylsulfate kinase